MFSRVEQVICSQEKQFSLRQTLTNHNKPMAASAALFCVSTVGPKQGSCMGITTFLHSPFTLRYEKAMFYLWFLSLCGSS